MYFFKIFSIYIILRKYKCFGTVQIALFPSLTFIPWFYARSNESITTISPSPPHFLETIIFFLISLFSMMHSDLQRFAVSSHFRSHFPKSFSLRKKVPWWYQILDPRSKFIAKWNRTFLYSCLAALFLDPLYFYIPMTGDKACMQNDLFLGVFVTICRTVADLFFLFHMVLKFRTAFVSPMSRVYGHKELVTDPKQIASRYLKSDFIVDLLSTLPLPQVSISIYIYTFLSMF